MQRVQLLEGNAYVGATPWYACSGVIPYDIITSCRIRHSPGAVQGRDALEEVCEPPEPEPSRLELLAGDAGIRYVAAYHQAHFAALVSVASACQSGLVRSLLYKVQCRCL